MSGERLLPEILRGERGKKEVLDSENPSDWGSGFILKEDSSCVNSAAEWGGGRDGNEGSRTGEGWMKGRIKSDSTASLNAQCNLKSCSFFPP